MSLLGRCLLLLVLLPLFGVELAPAAELKSLLEPVPGVSSRKPSVPVDKAGGVEVADPSLGILLTEGLLVNAIQQDLPKRFPIRGDLRIQLARAWNPMKLPGQDFFAECIQIQGGALTGNMSLTVRGVSAGKIIGEWPILVRAELWQEVWVASQRLDRGQVVTQAMVVPQKIDLLKELGQTISTETDLVGFELAQMVQQGRPIAKRDIVERSLVRRGQLVDAVANEGGLNIRMRAQAMEGGAAGAVIKVRNLDSNKEFVGQVINENQVQVRF